MEALILEPKNAQELESLKIFLKKMELLLLLLVIAIKNI